MLEYKDLVGTGILSESIFQLIFTDKPNIQRKMLAGRSLIRTSYRICCFYVSLVQAYIIGEAIYRDCRVTELGYPEKLIDAVCRNWPIGSGTEISQNSKTVFSTLMDISASAISGIVSENSALVFKKFRETYKKFEDDDYRDKNNDWDDADILALLKAFSLLSCTEVDFEALRFIFRNKTDFTVSCDPFVVFYENDYRVGRKTDEGYSLVSVKKGEKNGELILNVTELQKRCSSSQEIRPIRRQASKDENLRMICKALGMNTEWYEVEECWCDLAFLDYITGVTRKSLKKFWANRVKDDNMDVTLLLKNVFDGTEMQDRITADKKITLENIDTIFYELYINYGIFKTMWGVFYDNPEYKHSRTLFGIYMDEFEDIGKITHDQRMQYERECDIQINSRLEKLKGFVSQSTVQYDKRMRAIKAEWRANCILKAAGIRGNNLFTDEEAILSIDNYFEMIKNPTTTLKADLNSAMSFLIELYGPLLKVSADFDDEDYASQVSAIKEENKNRSTTELFECFNEIVEKSIENPVIEKHIGRSQGICDPRMLSFVSRSVTKHFEKGEKSAITKRSIFVSYCHADKEKVEKYVEKWLNAGYNIFFDEKRFKAGYDWQEKAFDAIESEECVAVFVFMSRAAAVSDAVYLEVEHAAMLNKNGEKDIVIAPINLESEEIDDYLAELIHSKKSGTYTSKLRPKFNGGNIIHYNYDTEMDTKVELRIRELLLTGDGDDYAYSDKYNDFELAVANFYSFLKYGDEQFTWRGAEEIDEAFSSGRYNPAKCIFPLVVSVKETKIKRDTIALAGYEIIRGKGADNLGTNYILSSKRLAPDDYYCIPNYRAMADDGSWMVNPLMICNDFFAENMQED